MVKISVDVDKIPLRKWISYKAPLPESSSKEHRIIIVFKTDIEIKFFWVTSQVNKAKMILRDDPNALVIISKDEWVETLTKDVSCIQCDKAHIDCVSIAKFKQMYIDGEITLIGEVPSLIQEKIKTAIENSITYNIVEQSQLTEGFF